MRFQVLLGLLATLAVAVDAKPLRRATKHVVHDEKPVSRRNWFRTRRLHRSAVLPVRIGLAQSNLERAEEFIYGKLSFNIRVHEVILHISDQPN
jgi:tripeptidyl-peptidase-1